MSSLIEVNNLSREYIKSNVSVKALSNVSFEINEGDFVSIIGKSGSGKSTLLNLLGGLDMASSGKIVVDSIDLSNASRKDLVMHRRNSVGMIFQSFNLILTRNAIENITLALAFGGMEKKYRNGKAIELLELVGLKDRVKHKPEELSGGEAQRVSIARALANKPKIILADEPTGNLDSITSKEIMSILVDLNKKHNKTIIMVTHDLEIAQQYSNKIIQLKDGQIVN